MTAERLEILTIGHSSLAYEDFLRCLRAVGATAVADVRSVPFSRRHPRFNRDSLADSLHRAGLSYVFLGDALGGRPLDRSLYREGVADYEKMARTRRFACGLERLIAGAGRYRIALMCSERHPLDCHRCLLVGRALADKGIAVGHVLDEKTVLDHSRIETELLELTGRANEDLFTPRGSRLAAAYRDRAFKVAWSEEAAESGETRPD